MTAAGPLGPLATVAAAHAEGGLAHPSRSVNGGRRAAAWHRGRAAIERPSVEPGVTQAGQLAPDPLQAGTVDLGQNDALTLSRTCHHRAPGIDEHRAGVVGEPVRAHASLVGGQEIALVLDRARAAEHVPVGGARGEGEGGRDEENLRAGPNQAAVELREAKVVADREAEDA